MSAPDLDTIIAHHEAGHIVARRRFGLPIVSVSMSPTREDNLAGVTGVNAAWLASDAELPVILAALKNGCIEFLAGPFAQLQYAPDDDGKEQLRRAVQSPPGCLSDMRQAMSKVASAALLETGACSTLSETGIAADPAICLPLFGQLCDETEKLVAENWPAIQRIALHLQRHRTITQDEADALIGA